MKTKIQCKRYSPPKAIALVIFLFLRVFICVLYLVGCETKYVLEMGIVYLLETWYSTYTVYTQSIIQTKNIEAWNNERGKNGQQQCNGTGVRATKTVPQIEMKIIFIYLIWFIAYKIHETHVDCRIYIWCVNWKLNILASREHQSYQNECCMWTTHKTANNFNISQGKSAQSSVFLQLNPETKILFKNIWRHMHCSPCSNNSDAEKRDGKLNPISVYIRFCMRVELNKTIFNANCCWSHPKIIHCRTYDTHRE